MSDFKVEAVDNIRLALEHPNGYHGMSSAELLQLAQVNATLELAEQQRIANLQLFCDGLERGLREGLATYESHPGQYAALETLGAEVARFLGVAP